jgi:hypothetical protein
MEHHKTKNRTYVKELLDHRKLDTTALYVRLDKALFEEATDEFYSATTRAIEEADNFIEAGFEQPNSYNFSNGLRYNYTTVELLNNRVRYPQTVMLYGKITLCRS